MADFERALGNDRDFSVSDVGRTRAELRAKRHLSRLREVCGDLRDNAKSVQCFVTAQDAETELDKIFSGSVE